MTAPARVAGRGAVATLFFLNGAVVASWVPHIPAVKDAHGLGDGALGLVLLAMAAGAVLALPPAGWLVGRLGSRRVTLAAGLALCAGLPLPVLAPTVPALVAALWLLGAANATLDVAMNAHALEVEARAGRPIMSAFHGLFSLGGVAGAGGAALAMAAGMGDVGHVAGVAGAGASGVLAVRRRLRAGPPAGGPGGQPGFVRPSRALLGLGALAFLALLAEGAMGDWSAVYLRDHAAASPALAAAGFAAFSLTMAAGRLGGDRAAGRLGAVPLLRCSAALAALALGAALGVGRPAAGLVGFAAVGLGIANLIPLLFRAAGSVPGVGPGTGLAAVASAGYLGFLAGPPLIGAAAELAGLPAALGGVAAACAVVAAAAGRVLGPRRSAPALGGHPASVAT